MRGPPAWRRPKGVRVAPGCVVTPAKAQALAEVARAGERGATACWGVMPGGTLAALHMFGLVDKAPPIDDLGGTRYRINPRGLELLQTLEPIA